MRNIIIAFIIVLNPFYSSYAQELNWPEDQSFNQPEINTGLILNILLQLTPQIWINDILVEEDALIGVFYLDDADVLQCGGFTIYTPGDGFAFPAYGDSPLTEDKDGFSTGESFQWYAQINGVDYPMQATYLLGGEFSFVDVYEYDGMSMVTSLIIEYTFGEVEGCTDDIYIEFVSSAIIDDGSCLVLIEEGCYDENAINYSYTANTSCIDCCEYGIFGCTDITALNYLPQANLNDNSCVYDLNYEFFNLSIHQEYIPLYLPEGWVMFGYTCVEPINVSIAFESIVDRVIIVKDNDGEVYLPEWNFNGIGDLIYSRGYQIKTTEEILDFSFCPTILVSEIQNDPYQIGDMAEGGIVFFLDESGEHGLVVAIEAIVGHYEWGCDETSISGADGLAIGTGYQNTIDILNQDCQTENGGITAAQAALDFVIEGYLDWYLPSKDELQEVYNLIGDGNSQENIETFSDWFWSSSEYDNTHSWSINFDEGASNNFGKNVNYSVCVIRNF